MTAEASVINAYASPGSAGVVEEGGILRPQRELSPHLGMGPTGPVDRHGEAVIGLLAGQLKSSPSGSGSFCQQPALGALDHLVDQAAVPLRQLLLRHFASWGDHSCGSLARWASPGVGDWSMGDGRAEGPDFLANHGRFGSPAHRICRTRSLG